MLKRKKFNYKKIFFYNIFNKIVKIFFISFYFIYNFLNLKVAIGIKSYFKKNFFFAKLLYILKQKYLITNQNICIFYFFVCIYIINNLKILYLIT